MASTSIMHLLSRKVKCALWASCFATVLPLSGQHKKLRPRFPLPARAQVVVDGPYNDIPKGASEHDDCRGFRTSPKRIRRLFFQDAQIDGPEHHNGIDEVACGISGRILLDGKVYGWQLVQSDPPGFVETDYPDGVSKYLAHKLGDLSDKPHPHRPSKYVDTSYWDQ